MIESPVVGKVCEIGSKTEKAKNSNIAIRIKKILKEREKDLSINKYVTFVSDDLPKIGIAVKSHLSQSDQSRRVPHEFNFPLYEIVENKVRFINANDNTIYALDNRYYFNNMGQSIHYQSIIKETSVNYLDNESNLAKIKNFLPGEFTAYSPLDKKNYENIWKSLELIESKNCFEVIGDHIVAPHNLK